MIPTIGIVGGIGSGKSLVADVMQKLGGFLVAADPLGGFAATFTTLSGTSRTVMAFDSSRLLAPGELASNTPSSWSDTNGNSNGSKGAADFYIVSNKLFIPSAATLKTVRDGEGTKSLQKISWLTDWQTVTAHWPLLLPSPSDVT